MKRTTLEMELALSNYLDIRQNIIVPNVSWGLFRHECDLIVCTKQFFCSEIEIKVSLSDLKKDSQKMHGHDDNKIKYLYFAIPSYLCKHIEYIPKRAGIYVVTSKGEVFKIAKPKINKNHRPLKDYEYLQLLRLGSIRLWSLKRKIMKLQDKA